jgi:hypothetical protein
LQKVHGENVLQKCDVIFFLHFLCFVGIYRVFGCFSARGVQSVTKKTFLQTNRQKIQNRFFLDFIITFLVIFGRFSGVQKYHKNNIGKKRLALSFFCPLTYTYLPTTGVADFFGGRPLENSIKLVGFF